MKMGVFDSGIGGRAVADRLQADYPDAEVMYVDDRVHVPYGSRTQDDITTLTDAAIQPLIQASCDVIVLACNTATAAAIEVLRAKYPATPFIGLEPMVKPASAATRSGVIAVCATPATLQSERYANLKAKFASGVQVLEPDCSDWAYLIENNAMDVQKIEKSVNEVCDAGADVIVLACTHYHWIKEEILHFVHGRAFVIDPSEAISMRVQQVLSQQTNSR